MDEHLVNRIADLERELKDLDLTVEAKDQEVIYQSRLLDKAYETIENAIDSLRLLPQVPIFDVEPAIDAVVEDLRSAL